MATKFDWHTGEDTIWDDGEREAAVPRGRARARSGYRLLLFVVVVMGAAGMIYWQLTQFVEETTADLKAEILAAHALLREAERQGDVELLTTLLSTRDRRWVRAHRHLLPRGGFSGRAPFGLTLTAAPAPDATDVTLRPDLTAAELTFEQTYRVDQRARLTETVTLQHTAVYRYVEQRWLLAPPEPEFWGSRYALETEYLTLSYPLRDEALARRLGEDLNSMIRETCVSLPKLT